MPNDVTFSIIPFSLEVDAFNSAGVMRYQRLRAFSMVRNRGAKLPVGARVIVAIAKEVHNSPRWFVDETFTVAKVDSRQGAYGMVLN